MRRIEPALMALALVVTAGTAHAQPPVVQPTAPYSPPVISPYLNLLHGGNPAVNYYGIVQPQIQQTRQLQMLQYGLNRTAAEATAAEAAATTPGGLANTGHTVGFMTYPRYFNTVNARGH